MRKYVLEAIVDGHHIKFNREFESRNSAMNYFFGYCDEFVINDEYKLHDEAHSVEYVNDYDNRFIIARAK